MTGLDAEVEQMMEAAWRPPGFCVPNQATYPHQWLWDSCFHALIWIALGSDRAVAEIEAVMAHQSDDGFVPHMTYWTEPEMHAGFWGRRGTSSITQPPMYGHAVAELIRAGHRVPDDLVDRAVAGLVHLGSRSRTPAGLVPVFHPWETGCDDSPRWDSWLPQADRAGRAGGWRTRKGELVEGLALSAAGHAVGSAEFAVGSIGFNALVAWNAAELLDVVPRGHRGLRDLVTDLTGAVEARWDGDRWVDDGPPSGRLRTLDAMLALLLDERATGFDALVDPGAFWAPYGPCGVDRREPAYEPEVYWRGPAWPQLTYLLMVAAERAGRPEVALQLARGLVAGAVESGFAEYWNPETGRGLGAVPQTWAGLAIVAARRHPDANR